MMQTLICIKQHNIYIIKMSNQIVFLDLEETIIDSWANGILVNAGRIKKWLDKNHLGGIHIWSFAIYDDKDQHEFETSGMKTSIEHVLGREILSSLSIVDMSKLVYQYEKLRYDNRSDFMQMNGKHWSFIKYCMGHQIGNKCILIDDCVPDWVLSDNNTGTIVELINVRNI